MVGVVDDDCFIFLGTVLTRLSQRHGWAALPVAALLSRVYTPVSQFAKQAHVYAQPWRIFVGGFYKFALSDFGIIFEVKL